MPAAGMVAGIVLMGAGLGFPTRPVWARIMKPNLIDRAVLGIRKHVFVRLFDKFVRILDTEDFPWVVPPLIGLGLLYLFGWPFMLYIRCRSLYHLLEDAHHTTRYPCRLIRGETGVNWRREGF